MHNFMFSLVTLWLLFSVTVATILFHKRFGIYNLASGINNMAIAVSGIAVSGFKRFREDTRGDQMTSWLLMAVIIVVVGAVIFALFEPFIREMWQSIFDTVRAIFNISPI